MPDKCPRAFPALSASCCHFHLGQSVYQHIQLEELQQDYSNLDDRNIKEFTHIFLALAIVPVADVYAAYEELTLACSNELAPVMKYFDVTKLWYENNILIFLLSIVMDLSLIHISEPTRPY